MDKPADLDALGTGSMERGEEGGTAKIGDSGICERAQDCDVKRRLEVVELKVEKLFECCEEQGRLLAAMKEQMTSTSQAVERATSEHCQLVSEIINITLLQRLQFLQLDGGAAVATDSADAGGAGAESVADAADDVKTRARALLGALEVHTESSIDSIVMSALKEFLQSDGLKYQLSSSTMQSVKHLIEEFFSKEVSAFYLPMLQRLHRRQLRQMTRTLHDTFREMEANIANSFRSSTTKTTRNINMMLGRHQSLVEEHQRLVEDSMASIVDAQTQKNQLNSILVNELQQWRKKATEMISELATGSSKQLVPTTATSTSTSLAQIPSSPPQPTEAGGSAIDQLVNAAEINVLMNSINVSFEKALEAFDLSLMRAACRAADPEVVFAGPCCLQQRVLLSLVQMLAADMAHDTQLKCRYLEGALIHLDTENPIMRSHLPVVMSQVRHLLFAFMDTFTSHECYHRIKVIVMAVVGLHQKVMKRGSQ